MTGGLADGPPAAGEEKAMRNMVSAAAGLLAALTLLSGAAWAEELLVGGQTVGIDISSDGVIVSGFAEVETAEGSASPAGDAGFEPGDVIIAADGTEVRSADELISAVAELDGRETELTVLRGGATLKLRVRPAMSSSGQWMLGMWLRDSVSGIGTLTFVDPASGTFGALGHGVNDENGSEPVPLRSGTLCDAEIIGVHPGAAGQPGELCGSCDSGRTLGSVERNTPEGVFGRAAPGLGGEALSAGRIRTGEAKMIATVAGHETEEYSVRIDRVYNDGGQTHAMLTVTDSRLRERAGGIVRGMSGSPIIQDGRIVGAVTHVFVNDPTRGFAIGIYDMLEAAGLGELAA